MQEDSVKVTGWKQTVALQVAGQSLWGEGVGCAHTAVHNNVSKVAKTRQGKGMIRL
jgi:hypothetical protein